MKIEIQILCSIRPIIRESIPDVVELQLNPLVHLY